MSDFGLLPEGFVRRRLVDVRDSINARLAELLEVVNLEEDSVIGQLVGVIANDFSILYQDLEDVYFSQYIDTADGTSLDNAVALIGFSRLAATATTVTAEARGVSGTTVPASTEFSLSSSDDTFTNASSFTISNVATSNVLIEVTTAVDNQTYTITIGGVNYSFTASNSTDLDEIADGLVSAVNTPATSVFTFSKTSAGIIRGLATENATVLLSSDMQFNEIWTQFSATASSTGAISVPVGALTEIQTPVLNLNEVNNRVAGVTGRARESDSELRARAKQGIALIATGTVDAIRTRLLQEVASVTSVRVFENRDIVVVNGRPAKSFEVVIEGGAEDEIATKIYEVKPAGIETFGSTTEVITNEQGQDIAINFSRPTEIFVWINVNLTVTGDFPIGGNQTVRQNLLELGNEQQVGDDVIWQKFFNAIYKVPGITSATLTFATSATAGGSPGSYSSANISIDEVEIASFDLARIQVS